MARVKTDFRSQLSRNRLEACFRISEEGKPVGEFNSDSAINLWFNEKVRRLGSSKHKYTKRKASASNSKGSCMADVTILSVSDLESGSSDTDDSD